MALRPIVALGMAAALAGCAALGYQPGDSYQHTRALAGLGNADALLQLARMDADPAAWPQMQGRPPNPVEAAKSCYIFQRQNIPARPAIAAQGPSCQQIMATLPPDALNRGIGLGSDYFNAMEPHTRIL